MNVWTLSHSRDGWAVRLAEIPAWAYLVSRTAEQLPPLYANHAWPWRIGVPREADGYRWTLGGAMYSGHNWLLCTEDRRGRDTHRIPVTEDVAARLQPDFVEEIRDIFAEEEEPAP